MRGVALRFLGQCLMPLGGGIVFFIETIQHEPFYDTLKRTYVTGDIAGFGAMQALARKALVASGFPVNETQMMLLENGVASLIQLYGFALIALGFLMYRVGLRH